MNKQELIKWLTEEQQKWNLLVAAIGDKRLEQAGVNGDWSMRDVIAHLTGWQRRLVNHMHASAQGQPTPPPPWPADLPTEDAINAWIYDANHTRPVREVLADAYALHQQLVAILHGLPDDSRVETIDGKFHLIWINDERFAVGEFFYHFYDDHAPDVHRWLGQTA
ncbi:ClbS/DfsB family four-helix bundle protein [bacterium]|nr:ClbS/DfsB family four-helix bundle protein [bacterium]